MLKKALAGVASAVGRSPGRGVWQALRRGGGARRRVARRRVGRAADHPRAQRLGQDDAAEGRGGLRDARRRTGAGRRHGHHRHAAGPARHRHGVPELRAVPASHGASATSPSRSRCATSASAEIERRVAEALGLVELDGLRQAPAAPALGRPAAARGAGPRHRLQPAPAAARRAVRRARPQAARDHAARGAPPAAPARPHHHLHHPRPGRGAGPVRPHRGDEQGRDPAGRLDDRDLRAAGQRFRRRLRGREQHLPRHGDARSARSRSRAAAALLVTSNAARRHAGSAC